MTDDPLAEVARAYRAAVEKDKAAKRAQTRAQARIKELRPLLAEQIVIAAKGGRRPKEIVELTGYTPERVRQVLRAAGVEPLESNAAPTTPDH